MLRLKKLVITSGLLCCLVLALVADYEVSASPLPEPMKKQSASPVNEPMKKQHSYPCGVPSCMECQRRSPPQFPPCDFCQQRHPMGSPCPLMQEAEEYYDEEDECPKKDKKGKKAGKKSY